VVPVERTDPEGDAVVLQADCDAGQHISRRAEDLAAGQVVATAGSRLHPSRLAACAAAGASRVEVWRAPSVRVMSSGDEVVPVGGGPLAPGQVYDSNAAALTALFESLGCWVERTPIVGDDRGALAEVLESSNADLTVTVGGTSVGRRDLVSDAVAAAGDVLAHGAAVRPGKPLLLARVAGHALIGLPGFPTSCLMMAYVTAVPVLRRMSRIADDERVVTAVLDRDVESPRGKTQFLPVQHAAGKAIPTFTFSSAVSSMALADGWIEIDSEVDRLPAGTEVQISLY
jgi:molybdopterin molybdotransferase